jgi:hypothetical protein
VNAEVSHSGDPGMASARPRDNIQVRLPGGSVMKRLSVFVWTLSGRGCDDHRREFRKPHELGALEDSGG